MKSVAFSIGLVGAILATGAGGAATAQEDGPLVHEGIVDAPVAEVWKVFTTGEGWKKLGVAKAEVDLRVGGLIRSHYSPGGVLGDEDTIQNRILAFEPERMLAICVDRPPRGFPFKEAWKSTWSVVTFTDLGGGRTHLRLAGLGYGADPESQAMRKFFLDGNAWTLKKLETELARAGPAKPGAPPAAPPPLAPIVAEAVVAAPVADVFAAFTTAAGWKAFFGVEARIGAHPGEPFEILFDPEAPEGQRGSEGCVRLGHVPLEMFSFTWNAPPHLPTARTERTWVVVDFDAPAAGLTHVRLRHLGFAERAAAGSPEHTPEWEKTRAYFASAWPAVLGALKRHFEGK